MCGLFLKHPYKRFCFFIFLIFTKRDLSLSLCLPLSHSLSHTISLYLCLPLPHTHALYLSVYVSLSLSLTHTRSLSISLSMSPSLTLPLTHSVYLSVYVTLTHYLSLSMSPSLSLTDISLQVPRIDPLVSKRISLERLSCIAFTPNRIIISCIDGM